MTQVGTYGQLLREIKRATSKALEDVGDDMVDIVKEEVDEAVYSSYTPIDYVRTGELAESIESKIINDEEVEIKHDLTKIYANSPNQHMSVKSGADISSYIPKIVHNTGAPNIFNNNNYVWEKERPYMDNTIKRLSSTKEHVNSMKKNLRKKGFDIK